MAGEQPARSVGRPRDEDLSRRILDAARIHVRDVGFTAFRVNDVAASIGCGVSTIYRRWPTREHLIADAIATRPPIDFDRTGDPVEDLRAGVDAVIKNLGLSPVVLAAALELVQHEDELAVAIRGMVTPVREMLRELVAAVAGDDNPNVAMIVDAVPGMILVRSVLMGEDVIPAAIADEVVTIACAA